MTRPTLSGSATCAFVCLAVLCAVPARAATDCPVLALDGLTGYATASGSVYPGSTAPASFTVEAWFHPTQLPPEHSAATIVSDDVYDLELVNLAGVPAIRVTLWGQEAIPNHAFLEFGYGGLGLQQWNHVALVFDAAAGQARVFVNGVPGAARPVAFTYLGVFGNVFLVGAYPAAGYFLGGYVDEVRISSVVRYTGGFTPQASLSVDAQTLALYRFEDALGAAGFADATDPGHALVASGGAQAIAIAGCAPASIHAWTDAIGQGFTIIRRIHIDELRDRIDGVRAAHGLGAYPWTDSALVHGSTRIKAIHLQELRFALTQAYAAALRPAPPYTDEPLVAGATTIKAIHLTELRAAVQALE